MKQLNLNFILLYTEFILDSNDFSACKVISLLKIIPNFGINYNYYSVFIY